MKKVTITRSENLDPTVVDDFLEVFESLNIEVESQEYFYRSASGGPTFIQVLADLATWEIVLKISVTAFLAEFSKQAAQDLWKNKKKFIDVLSTQVCKPLKFLTKSISKAKEKFSYDGTVTIGLSFPDDHFGSVVGFETKNEEEIVFKIVLFINNLKKINKTIEEINNSENRPIGPVILEISEEGKIFINWFGRKDHSKCKKEIK